MKKVLRKSCGAVGLRRQPTPTMSNTAKYIRQNDNKEYTILEVNEDLKQIILRDTNTGTTLKMAKQSFANNFKLA
jgi:hypothetical protein